MLDIMRLDIGCGNHKDPGWFGIDIQALPGVDLVHDLNVHPWPLGSGTIGQAKAWHICEHIPKVSVTELGTRRPFIEFMDEIWRILRVGSILDIESPYGSSAGFIHDPTHVNQIDELTFEHFDPTYPRFKVYQPRPWRIMQLSWTVDGNVNIILEKRPAEI
jgi:predicted SAM-dependent methyltransferase